MLTDSSFLKKITTAQITLIYPCILANLSITITIFTNKTDQTHIITLNNHISKQIHEHKTNSWKQHLDKINTSTIHTPCGAPNICHQITKGFNNPRPPQRTVAVALDMSKVFDTVNIHKLINKLTVTNISNIIIKFIANYVRGLFKKYPTFLYKAHNTINFASFIQSPSKYSPWWFTHLSQRFCHFSKHFINSSPGML